MTGYVFSGFEGNPGAGVEIPEEFFRDVVPRLRDLAEVKLMLQIFWLLSKQRGSGRRYCHVTISDLAEDKKFLAGIARSSGEGARILPQALSQAVVHGLLLAADVNLEGRRETWYFLNDPVGREAITRLAEEGPEAILAGEEEEHPVPNIFALYEENIGMIQPLLAEELKDAAREYPPAWIEEAFRIAAENNARRWSYVRAILERWRTEGREERRADTDSLAFRMRYARGE